MNKEWKHNAANVARIARVNTLLNDNIKEAIEIGQYIAESLSWMEQATNECYNVEVMVYRIGLMIGVRLDTNLSCRARPRSRGYAIRNWTRAVAIFGTSSAT